MTHWYATYLYNPEQMIADAAACRCHLLDTPYGLKVFFQGRVNKKTIIILFLFAFMTIPGGLLVIMIMLYKVIYFPDKDVLPYWATIALFLSILIYLIWNLLPIFKDQLLVRDTVTINSHYISIQKSGFLSLVRYKEFPISSNHYFLAVVLYNESRIMFGNSFNDVQQYRSDFRIFSPSPMRSFCRGLSPVKAEAVIDQIYQKYPVFDINAYRDQLFEEDETY
jgi:hypothetical protein